MHPHIRARREQGPVTHEAVADSLVDRLALTMVRGVGTMGCALLFACLTLLGLPPALHTGGLALIMWFSSTFLQLVLLPVIMVGQNLQARASDRRALQTFDDVEAIFSLLTDIHQHTKPMD